MEMTSLSSAVTDYIQQQEGWQRDMLLQLRQFILSQAPQMQEQFKYGGAFYYCFGMVCYLAPQKDHVYIGFVQGLHLSNEQGLFAKPDTKQIRKVRLYPDQPIPTAALHDLLQEAILFNELKKQKKKTKSAH